MLKGKSTVHSRLDVDRISIELQKNIKGFKREALSVPLNVKNRIIEIAGKIVPNIFGAIRAKTPIATMKESITLCFCNIFTFYFFEYLRIKNENYQLLTKKPTNTFLLIIGINLLQVLLQYHQSLRPKRHLFFYQETI